MHGPRQWKKCGGRKSDEELKAGWGEACLSGAHVLGGLSEEVSAVGQIEAD